MLAKDARGMHRNERKSTSMHDNGVHHHTISTLAFQQAKMMECC